MGNFVTVLVVAGALVFGGAGVLVYMNVPFDGENVQSVTVEYPGASLDLTRQIEQQADNADQLQRMP